MSENILRVGITTNITIVDDLGNELLNASNAIHPQNMSRIIARALANEPNSTLYKLALGNGGTYVDATGATSYRRPNDGISPDLQGWQSRLYNETYSEIVDEGSPLLGQGAGAFPGGDGLGIGGARSLKLPTGESQVVVTCVLNKQEPTAQLSNSLTAASVDTYTFDELGLFTAGLPAVSTQGYQDVVLNGGKIYTDLTHLSPAPQKYYFEINVDGTKKCVLIELPTGTGAEGKPTYTDLKQAIDALNLGVVVQVSQPGVNTLGNLRFRSIISGTSSSVVIADLSAAIPTHVDATESGLSGLSELLFTNILVVQQAIATGITRYTLQQPGIVTTWLFSQLLKAPAGDSAYVGLGTAFIGEPQGEEDNPAYPQNERERMLTHLIFSPLQKDASRSWKITYKLTVIVQQSDSVN